MTENLINYIENS